MGQSFSAWEGCNLLCVRAVAPGQKHITGAMKLYWEPADFILCPYNPAYSSVPALLIWGNLGVYKSLKYICSLHFWKPYVYLQTTTLKAKHKNKGNWPCFFSGEDLPALHPPISTKRSFCSSRTGKTVLLLAPCILPSPSTHPTNRTWGVASLLPDAQHLIRLLTERVPAGDNSWNYYTQCLLELGEGVAKQEV